MPHDPEETRRKNRERVRRFRERKRMERELTKRGFKMEDIEAANKDTEKLRALLEGRWRPASKDGRPSSNANADATPGAGTITGAEQEREEGTKRIVEDEDMDVEDDQSDFTVVCDVHDDDVQTRLHKSNIQCQHIPTHTHGNTNHQIRETNDRDSGVPSSPSRDTNSSDVEEIPHVGAHQLDGTQLDGVNVAQGVEEPLQESTQQEPSNQEPPKQTAPKQEPSPPAQELILQQEAQEEIDTRRGSIASIPEISNIPDRKFSISSVGSLGFSSMNINANDRFSYLFSEDETDLLTVTPNGEEEFDMETYLDTSIYHEPSTKSSNSEAEDLEPVEVISTHGHTHAHTNHANAHAHARTESAHTPPTPIPTVNTNPYAALAASIAVSYCHSYPPSRVASPTPGIHIPSPHASSATTSPTNTSPLHPSQPSQAQLLQYLKSRRNTLPSPLSVAPTPPMSETMMDLSDIAPVRESDEWGNAWEVIETFKWQNVPGHV